MARTLRERKANKVVEEDDEEEESEDESEY